MSKEIGKCDVEGCERSCMASHNHEQRHGTTTYGGCKCYSHIHGKRILGKYGTYTARTKIHALQVDEDGHPVIRKYLCGKAYNTDNGSAGATYINCKLCKKKLDELKARSLAIDAWNEKVMA